MSESISVLQAAKDRSEETLARLESHIKSCYESLSEHEGHRGGKL